MKKLGSPEFDGDKNYPEDNSKVTKEPIATPEGSKCTTSDDGCLAEALQNASSQNENSTQNASHEKETSEEKPSILEDDESAISKEELERDLKTLEEIAHRMSEYKRCGLGLLDSSSIDIENLCCMDHTIWQIIQVTSERVESSRRIYETIDGIMSAIVAASGPLDKSS